MIGGRIDTNGGIGSRDGVGIRIGHHLCRIAVAVAVMTSASCSVVWADDAPCCVFCRGAMPGPGASILNVAHAGASSLAPQNTLAAGKAALDAGADVWGVDVRRTRDGVFVLMHDETLDRTTDVEEVFPSRSPWRVASFSLTEILALDAGSWFGEDDPFGQIAEGNVSRDDLAAYVGEPIPTLREALEFVADNDWLIDIEVKTPLEVAAEVVAAELATLVRETETTNRVLVSSFDGDILREVRRFAPEIPIGALAIVAPPDTLETLRLLEVDVYLPSVVGFTAAMLADLDEAGVHVILWTYNTEQQLQRAAHLPGVDGIYTDFPQRLAAWLEEQAP